MSGGPCQPRLLSHRSAARPTSGTDQETNRLPGGARRGQRDHRRAGCEQPDGASVPPPAISRRPSRRSLPEKLSAVEDRASRRPSAANRDLQHAGQRARTLELRDKRTASSDTAISHRTDPASSGRAGTRPRAACSPSCGERRPAAAAFRRHQDLGRAASRSTRPSR